MPAVTSPASDELAQYELFVDGRAVRPSAGEYFLTEDPFTGRAWARIARGNAADVDAAVAAAHRAFGTGPWPALSPSERGRLLWKLGDAIAAHAPRLAEVERRDNGKLASEVTAQVRYMGDYFKYYAGLADKIQSDVIPTDKKGVFAYTRYEPKGVVAIITPWNSPLTLTSWKLAPALAAGCTAVVKPSEFTSASMVELAQIAAEAGLPSGVLNVVTGFGPEVGEPLVTHERVAHVGFTGGDAAGRKVYELAARGLKTVTLELGGKSPNIVFDDADFAQAVKGVVSGIFAASGQSCQAGSRLLLQASIHDRFIADLVAFMKDVKLGDPALPDTQMGPIATRPQFDKVMEYIRVAKEEGARCVLGGRARPDLGAGLLVEPTIFAGVRNDMRIAQEEVFGPVLAVIPFKDEQDAIRIANDIRFGLAAAVWTRSLHRAMLLTEKLQAGTVWVNNYRATSFTSPFGGYKQSGIGRESGIDTIREYLNTKCVWISTDLDVPNPFIRR
ncbi:MAG TPA: aldehyde dehydrogenase [Casimicrobiaceae bacterium]|jgi:aldehyde dehydrogenase (NAD+)